jgi:hypothetical protein
MSLPSPSSGAANTASHPTVENLTYSAGRNPYADWHDHILLKYVFCAPCAELLKRSAIDVALCMPGNIYQAVLSSIDSSALAAVVAGLPG